MISHAQPWGMPDHVKALHSTSSSRASNYADPEKDEAPRNKRTIISNNNRTQQHSHNYNHSRSFSGQNSLAPTHPAYASHDGRSSATPSPQPSRGHPAAYNTNTSSNHPLRNQVHNFSRMHSREPSVDSRSSTPQPPAATEQTAPATSSNTTSVPEGFVMPPPPPRAAKVPSIAVPSLGRARAPKKYIPPTINIEAATADESSSSMPRYHKVDPPPEN